MEVLGAHGVDVMVDAGDGFTPTPVVSHAILTHNRGGGAGTADGIVVTPSHNPPEDGGVKYNPPHGGPADTTVTGWISARPTRCSRAGCATSAARPTNAQLRRHDYVAAYVGDLPAVIDLDAIRDSGLRLGVDPLGGASVAYWAGHRRAPRARPHRDQRPGRPDLPLRAARLGRQDPHGLLVAVRDGRAARLADQFDVAFANDPDADRHGIVTPGAGLLNPNHHLAVCIDYLFGGAARLAPVTAVGKTLVSSAIIDRVGADRGRRVVEVPVGFKWFVAGLLDGTLGFGGEESAGASFVRRDGGPWSTDKDGLIPCLLAAEMTARVRRSGGALPGADRAPRPAVLSSHGRGGGRGAEGGARRALRRAGTGKELAGEPIHEVLTKAPGNDAPIGGVKVVAPNAWFAARPSGTEDVYKIYAESFLGEDHLARVIAEAEELSGRERSEEETRDGLTSSGWCSPAARASGLPLTADRAKPAVPFGGIYRLIDFVLSNLVNAGYRRSSCSRSTRPTRWTGTSRGPGGCRRCSATTCAGAGPETLGPQWFPGSADAIYQNLNLIDDDGRNTSSSSAPTTSTGWTRGRWSTSTSRPAPGSPSRHAAPIDQADQFGVIETADDGRTISPSSRSPRTPSGCPTRPTTSSPRWATTSSEPRR